MLTVSECESTTEFGASVRSDVTSSDNGGNTVAEPKESCSEKIYFNIEDQNICLTCILIPSLKYWFKYWILKLWSFKILTECQLDDEMIQWI